LCRLHTTRGVRVDLRSAGGAKVDGEKTDECSKTPKKQERERTGGREREA
jgi:hypothetical protein